MLPTLFVLELLSVFLLFLHLFSRKSSTASAPSVKRSYNRTFCRIGHVMETLIGSQSPRSLTLNFAGFPARKNGQQSFYPLLPVHELTKPCAFRPVKLYRLSCMAYLLFLLLKYCIAKTPPSTITPMMSVRMVGSMRQRPPARRRSRSKIFALQ